MTATCRDIITRAYRRLALAPLGQTLDAARAQEGLDAFNDLVASWQAYGTTDPAPSVLLGGDFINDTYTQQVALAEPGVAMDLTPPYGLNDNFPLDQPYQRGVVAMLAVELAPYNGIEASKSTQAAAHQGWRLLLAKYTKIPSAEVDLQLIFMPGQRRRWM